MTRTLAAWTGLLVSLFVALTFAASSCGVGELTLAGHPCPCGPGFVCDPAAHVCVDPSELAVDSGFVSLIDAAPAPCLGDSCACTTAADCKDPTYTKCVDSKCVECTSGPDTCGAGRYCLPSHLCAPGCKSDNECGALSPSAPFCNLARHQCVNCSVDTDCKNAQKCSPAGACVDGCAGGLGGTCTGGKACCNGLCLDTQSDPLNCNACGNACTGAQTSCCAGACADPLTSVTNCGQCGVACSTTNGAPSCNAGSCKWACNAGFSHCSPDNTGCETSTSSSVTQCGSCTTNCTTNVVKANGIACVASACTYTSCVTGFADCDGKKTNGCECAAPVCGGYLQVCCPGNVCNAAYKCEAAPANDGLCHNP
jgi:hypothetical protein